MPGDKPTDDTERDAGGMVWKVDESDTTECIDCGGRGVQIAELDSDRYLCSDCGLVWNPHQVDTENTETLGEGEQSDAPFHRDDGVGPKDPLYHLREAMRYATDDEEFGKLVKTHNEIENRRHSAESEDGESA